MRENKRGIPSGVSALAVIIGAYLLMRVVAEPPLPATLTNFFMIFVLAGVAIQLTLDDRTIADFLDFISFQSKQPPVWDLFRKVCAAAVPILVAYTVYASEKITYAPPAELYQPHVTPPQWVVDYKVPEWAADPGKWDPALIEEGKKVYEDNCAYCHGREADGKGPLAAAIRYPAAPTNFKEPGAIAQLPISYVYWRVRDGGIRDRQFRSAMPGWGDELDEEDLWKVIMYTYHKAGVRPRTWD